MKTGVKRSARVATASDFVGVLEVLEGKPSAFDRVSLELLALLSPGPEWSTGYPELESDRTPLARVNLAPAHKKRPRARVTREQNYLQLFLRLAALLSLGVR